LLWIITFMRLYFLRHADALAGADDAARPLSPRGWKQARRLGRFLEEAGVVFDMGYTSPLVRARETAEVVLNCCGVAATSQLKKVEVLANDATQKRFDAWLRSLPDLEHVLLVGHAPTLAERVRSLLGLQDESTLSLPKGAVVCLETKDQRTAALKFFVTPKLLGA
jgi:phosphohistidine phosphatase